ncbi:hypothetical protein KF840_03725 [bacterium]|nr:hypothetical protein [bacterium]
MMVIDFTAEAAPVIYVMIAILVVSAVGVAIEPTARALRTWVRALQPRFHIRRPALGHSR